MSPEFEVRAVITDLKVLDAEFEAIVLDIQCSDVDGYGLTSSPLFSLT